jgi:hypothetical protein
MSGLGLSNEAAPQQLYAGFSKGAVAVKIDGEKKRFRNIRGYITGFSYKRAHEQSDPKFGDQLILHLVAGNDTFLLNVKLDSGYGETVHQTIGHIDFTKPVLFEPTYVPKEDPNAPGDAGLKVFQNNKMLPWTWTKKMGNQNVRPEWGKIMHPSIPDKVLAYDKVAFHAWNEQYMVEVIAPRIQAALAQASAANIQATVSAGAAQNTAAATAPAPVQQAPVSQPPAALGEQTYGADNAFANAPPIMADDEDLPF